MTPEERVEQYLEIVGHCRLATRGITRLLEAGEISEKDSKASVKMLIRCVKKVAEGIGARQEQK